MPDYQQGKIYTIRKRTDDTLIYVGSTCETLARRLANHKRSFTNNKKHSSISLYSHITDLDDFSNNWYIELHSLYPSSSKMELNKREGEVIREIGTINKNIAGRDRQQYKIDNPEINKIYYRNNKDKIKKYVLDNFDKLKEYQTAYRSKNAEKSKEYNEKYRLEQAEKIREQRKQYRLKNAEKIRERKKQYYLKKKAEKETTVILDDRNRAN